MLGKQDPMEQVENFDDTTFTAVLYLYSKGDSQAVSLDWQVSHEVDEDTMPVLPASYDMLQKIWHGLMEQAQKIDLKDELGIDPSTLEDTPSDKAHATVLSAVEYNDTSGVEEAVSSTIH